MSATLDEKLFSRYFAQDQNGESVPCPALSVPGRTFPVQEKYLGDLLPELRLSYGRDLARLPKRNQADPRVTGDYIDSERAFMRLKTEPASTIDWKRRYQDSADGESQTEKEEARVPMSLIAGTIAHICKTTPDGAILVFLPGLEEITGTKQLLMQAPLLDFDFNSSERFKICSLHSAVPADEQGQVLAAVPQGCRKIILSTNIAETSVTVPDVKYVVDTGKMKEKRYDQLRRITKLQCTWESNSNARQRAGRAGRVQEGHYYALYTRERRQAMTASGLPEILRIDLQETCLSIKAQGFKEPVAEFLGKSIEPPSSNAIEIATKNLQAIEAFTQDEQITSLGRLLSKLKVHPVLGKMIILGIVFRCLDPMLILGSMDNERSLFSEPVGAKEEARSAHQKFGERTSDHLAKLEAFNRLRRLSQFDRMGEAQEYARRFFLHMGVSIPTSFVPKDLQQLTITSGIQDDQRHCQGE